MHTFGTALLCFHCAAALALMASPCRGVEVKPYGSLDLVFESVTNRGTNFTEGAMAGKDAFLSTADYAHNFGDAPLHKKHFIATQRFVLGAEFIASENVSAVADFILGNFTWGGPATNADGAHPAPMPGGALGTRAANIVTRQAYLNWKLPHTSATVRIGQQFVFTPLFATGSISPLHGGETGTGIMINAPVNDAVSVTGGWVRAISDPRRGGIASDGHTDDVMDLFLLSVPVKLDTMRFTPWGAMVLMGKDARYMQAAPYRGSQDARTSPEGGVMAWRSYLPLPAASNAAFRARGIVDTPGRGETTAWFAGLGGEFTMFDPLRLAFDAACSGSNTGHREYDRAGWVVGASAEYKTAWGVPTLKGWYASGDDGNIINGSERAVTTGGFSASGASGFMGGTISYNMFSGLGNESSTGTWGVSAAWNKLSLLENLFHNFYAAYIQGTNHKNMAYYADPHYVHSYMTTRDSVVALGFDTIWSLDKNLAALVEISYIIPNFDGKLRAHEKTSAHAAPSPRTEGVESFRYSDAWRVGVYLRYTF